MKTIQFQYRKSPENITDREAIILSPASNNYFTLDITELDKAEKVKLETGATFIHPSNDDDVIHGQGTAAIELLIGLRIGYALAFVPSPIIVSAGPTLIPELWTVPE